MSCLEREHVAGVRAPQLSSNWVATHRSGSDDHSVGTRVSGIPMSRRGASLERELRKVGIVGAGAMGRGIAHVCAAAKCTVQLFDNVEGAATRALESVCSELEQAVAKG